MTAPLRLFLQTDLLRDRSLGLDPGYAVLFDTDGDWKATLAELENSISGDIRPLVIASLEAVSHIQRHLPGLSRGVLANFDLCRFSRSMSLVPRELRLNPSFILLPFGELAARGDDIETLFGPHIFLRPDDGRKSFSGFSLSTDALAAEVNALRQTQHVRDDEICVVAPARDIQAAEFRCWLIEGEVATIAAYSHDAPTTYPAPACVRDLARQMAQRLEIEDDALVLDIALLSDDTPRVIEINAPSTSGIYPSASIEAIMKAVDPLLVSPAS